MNLYRRNSFELTCLKPTGPGSDDARPHSQFIAHRAIRHCQNALRAAVGIAPDLRKRLARSESDRIEVEVTVSRKKLRIQSLVPVGHVLRLRDGREEARML